MYSLVCTTHSPLDPRRPLYMVYMFIAAYHCPKGILGLGGASKNKLKDTNFIFPMTKVTVLSVFRTHAQKEYRKVFKTKSTYILNIIALLLLENLHCINSKSGLNGTQYKDVKWGVGVESTTFHGYVNDESFWNGFFMLTMHLTAEPHQFKKKNIRTIWKFGVCKWCQLGKIHALSLELLTFQVK